MCFKTVPSVFIVIIVEAPEFLNLMLGHVRPETKLIAFI